MGGMRALLLQAVHPAVASVIENAGTYHGDPWARHARTLQLMFTMFLAPLAEASAAVRLINHAHRAASGSDPATGETRRANEPELLLWVHASLVTSFLLFERLTVGVLDDAGRQRVHRDLAGVAELLGVRSETVPGRFEELVSYVEDTARTDVLRSTTSSRQLKDTILRDVPALQKVKLRSAAFLSLHTLPAPVRPLYGVEHSGVDEWGVLAGTRLMRWGRRVVPRRWTLLDPALGLPR